MAITGTQVKNSASVVQVAVGRYIDTASAAAFTITLGFKPLYVKVQNLNSSGFVAMEFYHGMAADSAVKTALNGGQTLITSDGITQNSNGFTVGNDTDLIANSEQLSWFAIG